MLFTVTTKAPINTRVYILNIKVKAQRISAPKKPAKLSNASTFSPWRYNNEPMYQNLVLHARAAHSIRRRDRSDCRRHAAIDRYLLNITPPGGDPGGYYYAHISQDPRPDIVGRTGSSGATNTDRSIIGRLFLCFHCTTSYVPVYGAFCLSI